MDWLDNITTIATSSGLTGGGLVTLFFILLSRNVIWTNGAHKEILERDARANAVELAAKDTIIEMQQAQLAEKETDKAKLTESLEIQRSRSDTLQTKMTDEMIPLVRVATEQLRGLNSVKTGEGT